MFVLRKFNSQFLKNTVSTNIKEFVGFVAASSHSEQKHLYQNTTNNM